ncbi:diguanylate cyclase [Vibrio sp. SCSIO 43136]|uniref:diguanylate cyclase n=1 Tax=Vibrio sp. SCSIO 43136 TaxID=2819101 RepID=UPI00207596B1|nr:diguanylate cyclase [Vibrio sp. SCSIO 43136]USD64745.1 diguanylate cyclase [Vibrio sp. SCSIO 43136]
MAKWILLISLFLTSFVAIAEQDPDVSQLSFRWFQGDALSWSGRDFDSLKPIDEFQLTGGVQVSQLAFRVHYFGEHVIDFRNSALIGRYQHYLYDKNNRLILSSGGGIGSTEPNEFFLRHGTSVYLEEGDYQLVTVQESQFNIAPPTPFVLPKAQYSLDIRMGNAITLCGLGIFVGLFFYYLVLSAARKSLVDFSYAIFILGNLLFNATSLQAMHQLFGIQWFGGASWPIFFSNIAYILFVFMLLKITRKAQPMLWFSGFAIIAMFVAFIVLALFYPNYQNEMNRLSVGVFISFGLVAGAVMSWRGDTIARLYLLANIGFFILAMVAITQEQIASLHTIYMSHIGLLAVACEVLLLSFVIAYQMGQLESERNQALVKAKQMLKVAQTDPLTQLPNRYAMHKRLEIVSAKESFVYADLDGLKQCNDEFGHEVGDQLLKLFATNLSDKLPASSQLFRISGDEFGIILNSAEQEQVVQKILDVEKILKQKLKGFVGVSFGMASFAHGDDKQAVVQRADHNMYLHKKSKKSAVMEI